MTKALDCLDDVYECYVPTVYTCVHDSYTDDHLLKPDTIINFSIT